MECAKLIRVGTGIGIDFAFVQNISSTPITLLDIALAGTGNGTLIRPVEMKIALDRVRMAVRMRDFRPYPRAAAPLFHGQERHRRDVHGARL